MATNSSIECVEWPTVKIVSAGVLRTAGFWSAADRFSVGNFAASPRLALLPVCRFALTFRFVDRLGFATDFDIVLRTATLNEFFGFHLTPSVHTPKISRLDRAGVAHW
jgi:hypothetical protein